MSRKPVPKSPEVETTGHTWDGIKELNTPLPRWWLWTFYLTIIWGIGYVIAYPAWPLINGSTRGLVGQDMRGDVAAEIDRFAAANGPIEARLVAADLTAISADPDLAGFAVNAGGALFRTWCAQCHGSGAAGAKGYPNLLDNDWLWGGTMADIHLTVSHGVRNTEDPEARFSQMPAFGEVLAPDEIRALVSHVQKLSGQDHDAAEAASGAVLYADNCVACHAEAGTGDRLQGAPDLTDAIWLYGGDAASLTQTVTAARFGVMPAWTTRLSEAEIRAVAVYVHSRGGGE